MNLFEFLLSIPAYRKFSWKRFYPILTQKMRDKEVLFLNYAFEAAPPVGIDLDPADESNRGWIQLYHHVASQDELAGKNVLEVSCGHGGGASWITRTMRPAHYTALDLNPDGIAFCQRRHQLSGLAFQEGDAQQLPFADESFDTVINVEASHCYPDFPGFMREVARVLKPGGRFLYADFRFHYDFCRWMTDIEESPLKRVRTRDITDEVTRGMRCNAAIYERLIRELAPGWMVGGMMEFAGLPGSRLHTKMRTGKMIYRSWCLQKP